MARLLSDKIYRAKMHASPFSTLVPASPTELDTLRLAIPGIPEAFYEFARAIGLGLTMDENATFYLPTSSLEVLNNTSTRLYNGSAMQSLRALFGGAPTRPPMPDLTRIYQFCSTGASWLYCFVPHLDDSVYTLDFAGPTLDEEYGVDFITFIEGFLEQDD